MLTTCHVDPGCSNLQHSHRGIFELALGYHQEAGVLNPQVRIHRGLNVAVGLGGPGLAFAHRGHVACWGRDLSGAAGHFPESRRFTGDTLTPKGG